jgi:hypothetical protein
LTITQSLRSFPIIREQKRSTSKKNYLQQASPKQQFQAGTEHFTSAIDEQLSWQRAQARCDGFNL